MKVRSLIGPMSSAAGREGIARLLAAAPRGYRSAIAASQCDSWEDVLERVAVEPYDVLIAEFGAGSPAIDRLFQLQPKLSVIEVDVAGGTTKVHVFDVGNETLVRLAEWLSREAGLTGANDTIARITHARSQVSVAAAEPSADREAPPKSKPKPAAKTTRRPAPRRRPRKREE